MRLHPFLNGPGREAEAVLFGREHLDELSAPRDERGQRLRLFIWDQPDGWTDGFGEPGEDLGIEPIRLRKLSRDKAGGVRSCNHTFPEADRVRSCNHTFYDARRITPSPSTSFSLVARLTHSAWRSRVFTALPTNLAIGLQM